MGREHSFAYCSRNILPRDTGYSTAEPDCLSSLLALKRFARYVFGFPVTVFTDHNYLNWLLKHVGFSTVFYIEYA